MKIKFLFVFLFLPKVFLGNTIDFQTALKLTIENHKELKAKKLDLENAKMLVEEAESYEYGKLVFNENIANTNQASSIFGMKMASREASFNDFGFGHFINNMGGLINPSSVNATTKELLNHKPDELNNPKSQTNFETKITYEMPIFTGFKIENAKKIAKLQLLASNAKFNYDEKLLGLEVFRAYNGAVTAKELIKATKKAKEVTAYLVNLANEFFKEGLITDIDVKQSLVYDMNVNAKLIEAENNYELALSYLRFLTENQNLTDVKEFENINFNISGLNYLQNNALNLREDLKYLKHNVDILKTTINYEDSYNYPQVAGSIEYGYNNNNLNYTNEQDSYLAAIGISYTIFDAGLGKIRKEKAKVNYLKNSLLLENMEDGIKLEIINNVLELNSKEKILEQKIKAEDLSKEILFKSIQMYQNQLINMSNLLQQQAYEQKAIAETILAKYEKNIVMAKLKISIGESLEGENK